MSVFEFENTPPVGLELVLQRVADQAKAKQVAEREKVNNSRLRRGATRTALIYDLAQDIPFGALANRYQCVTPTIRTFAQDYALEIQAARDNLNAAVIQERTTLWVTDKLFRMTEYQQALTDLENEIVRLIENGKTQNIAGLIRIKFQGLRHVAEELGELPPRVAIQNNNTMVNYTLEGVDMEVL